MFDKSRLVSDDRKEIIETAMGRRPPDLLISGGRLLDVYSGEIRRPVFLTTARGRIASVADSPPPNANLAGRTISAGDRYLLPGFVDPHAHIDFWANPYALLPELLKSGTTAILADPHDFTGAVGPAGLALLIRMMRETPLFCRFTIPAAAPPYPEFEGPDVVPASVLADFLTRPEISGISEVTPWPAVVSGNKRLHAAFSLARKAGKRVEGHTAGADFHRLSALAAAGVTSCHEAVTAAEALNRLRAGMAVMLRHGSIRSDLPRLVELLTKHPSADRSRIMLTPDWMSPADLLAKGYMDHLLREAVALGADPVTAVRAAASAPAAYLGLDGEIGALAPGRRADIVIVDDITHFIPHTVIAAGEIVVAEGTPVYEPPPLPRAAEEIPWLSIRRIPEAVLPEDFAMQSNAVGSVTVPALGIADKTITRLTEVSLSVSAGQMVLPAGGDVLKAAVQNLAGDGFTVVPLTGLGGRIGGIATSIAHETHRPIVVGGRDADMAVALLRVKEMGGGVSLVSAGKVVCEIPLTIGGVMSSGSLPEIARQMETMNRALIEMGAPPDDPLFTLTFLSFSALPWARLTPAGLLDVKRRTIVYP